MNGIASFILGVGLCFAIFGAATSGFDNCKTMPTGPYFKGRAAYVCVFKVPA